MTERVRQAAVTDQGRVSDHNEDTHALGEDVWVVADGMGGHTAGELASRVVVDAVLRHTTSQDLASDRPLQEVLADALVAGRGALTDRVRQEPESAGMGTTAVVAARRGDELAVAWVGDSRAYLLVDGSLARLTSDHNVAEEMLALGMIDAEEARTHPGQYRLTRALTGDDGSDATPATASFPARGRLMLCSDGLNGEVDDAHIAPLLGQADPETAARALVHAALDAGGRDNVTVVVVDL